MPPRRNTKLIIYLLLFLALLLLAYYYLTSIQSSTPILTPTPTPYSSLTPTLRPTPAPTQTTTPAPTQTPTTPAPTQTPTPTTPAPTQPFVDITPAPTVLVNNFLGVWVYNTNYLYVFDSGYRWFFYRNSTLLNYGTYQTSGTSCSIIITNQLFTNDPEEWAPTRFTCVFQASPKTITNTYIVQTLTYQSATNPNPTPPVPTTPPPSLLPTLPPVPTTLPPYTPAPIIISTPAPVYPIGVQPDHVSCYPGHDGATCTDLVCLNGGTPLYSTPTINDRPPYCSCLGNYDPATNCGFCIGNYDISTNCQVCLPGLSC
jgi:hypothetical protein